MQKTLQNIGFPCFWKHLGGLLERLGAVLEPSWSCLEATAATDAAFNATEDASESSWIDLQLLRSALGATSAVLSLLSLLTFLAFFTRIELLAKEKL